MLLVSLITLNLILLSLMWGWMLGRGLYPWRGAGEEQFFTLTEAETAEWQLRTALHRLPPDAGLVAQAPEAWPELECLRRSLARRNPAVRIGLIPEEPGVW